MVLSLYNNIQILYTVTGPSVWFHTLAEIFLVNTEINNKSHQLRVEEDGIGEVVCELGLGHG